MESTIGLYKTEPIKPRRPWKTLAKVELATAWGHPRPKAGGGSTGTTSAACTVR